MIAHLYLVMIWQALAPFNPTGKSMKGKIGQRSSSVHNEGPFLFFGGGGLRMTCLPLLHCSKLAKVTSVCSHFASCAVNKSPSRVFIFECVNE